MLVSKSQITEYIPQRSPMVMVDVLRSSDELRTTSTFTPGVDNMFCTDGYFSEPGLIENMAQTAALKAGFDANEKGLDVKVGFIGAVKNFRLHHLPRSSDELTTTVTFTGSFWNVNMFKCAVFTDGKIVAEAELSIFTQEDQDS